MTKLAQVMSHEEGWGILGKIPTTHNNPLDLRHSPHSQHSPNSPDGIGQIDTIEHGWEDADRQLKLYADRGISIEQMIKTFAPENENNTWAYLDYVCKNVPCNPWDLVSEVIKK